MSKFWAAELAVFDSINTPKLETALEIGIVDASHCILPRLRC
jgi:hypothetical protein